MQVGGSGKLVVYPASTPSRSLVRHEHRSESVAKRWMLHVGETLQSQESIWSRSSTAELLMQPDGNLVIYSRPEGEVVWATMVYGSGQHGSILTLTPDGDLQVQSHGTAVWNTRTAGGYVLQLQDDGNLELVSAQSKVLWQSGSSLSMKFDPSSSRVWRLFVNEVLQNRDSLWSRSGKVELVVQADGNLVLYSRPAGQVLWATMVHGDEHQSAVLTLTADGDLQVQVKGSAIWSAQTSGGRVLEVEDSGNLVVYSGTDEALWESGSRLNKKVHAA